MKKFRFLAVLALAISMLFVVASAAYNTFDEVVYDGSSDTITVTVRITEDVAVGMFSGFGLTYDNAVFSVASMDKCIGDTPIDYGTYVGWANSTDVNLKAGDAMLTVVFNVLDKAAAVGAEFAVKDDTYMIDPLTYDPLDFAGSVVVEADAPVVKTPATVSDAVAAYETFKGGNGKTYNNVWVGTYTITANDDTVEGAKLILRKGATDILADTVAAPGAIVEFKAAVVGATLADEIPAELVIAE